MRSGRESKHQLNISVLTVIIVIFCLSFIYMLTGKSVSKAVLQPFWVDNDVAVGHCVCWYHVTEHTKWIQVRKKQ